MSGSAASGGKVADGGETRRFQPFAEFVRANKKKNNPTIVFIVVAERKLRSVARFRK